MSSAVRRERRLHPAQYVVIAFGITALIGTGLLLLPISTAPGNSTDFVTALFTAVSAVCITGLTVVETGTHWSVFGQVVIMILIQLGGLGIVAFASMVGLLIAGKLSLKDRMNTVTEAKVVGIKSVPDMLRKILLLYFGFELVLAIWLVVRFYTVYKETFLEALWYGVFHAISSFNNGGFSLFENSMMGFNTDMFIIAPVMLAVVVGGLGFPVLLEIHQRIMGTNLEASGKRRRFSLHSRITLWATGILIVGGSLFIGALEWNNPNTLGTMSVFDRIMNTLFSSIMTRSGGLNSIDTGAMDPATWIGMDFLMFIGGGSASTAGGIKVTTIAIIFYIIYTEIRGETAVNIGNRRLPRSIQRQALTLVTLSTLAILTTTTVFVALTDFTLDQVLFDVISAAATVGLSTGITPLLPDWAKVWMSVLMFIGRLGPIVVASALALRITRRHYELPKERPLIG